ncbi:MAG: (d)CMP kinase [Odoribacteraceae bacterium]|jgi:cytidylate kinase|nr:(d)CMP kinase [Odoribacteraceae bacterium]
MEQTRLIIAVDGYSSTGKSTVSKRLAARLGYTYIDTGAMYRMVTYRAMQEGILRDGKVDDDRLKHALTAMRFDFKYNTRTGHHESYLDGKQVDAEIRGLAVSNNVSLISALAYVREVLVSKQREMGREGGVVMDGRDIGSVVFPRADVKFFMTASPATRARRRYEEMRATNETVSYEEVEANVLYRDHADSSRAASPLIKTRDAIEIDTSETTIEEEVEQMLAVIHARHASRD